MKKKKDLEELEKRLESEKDAELEEMKKKYESEVAFLMKKNDIEKVFEELKKLKDKELEAIEEQYKNKIKQLWSSVELLNDQINNLAIRLSQLESNGVDVKKGDTQSSAGANTKSDNKDRKNPQPPQDLDSSDMVEGTAGQKNDIFSLIRSNKDSKEICEAIEQLKDVNVPEEGTKQTPLHVAALNGFADVVTCLLKHHADVSCLDSEGRTPLYCAVEARQTSVVGLLANNMLSGDLNEQAKSKDTALHLAVKSGDHNMTTLLLKAGASPNVQDGEGNTCLHLAAADGDLELVKILANNHADLKSMNYALQTPTDLAKGDVKQWLKKKAFLQFWLESHLRQLQPMILLHLKVQAP